MFDYKSLWICYLVLGSLYLYIIVPLFVPLVGHLAVSAGPVVSALTDCAAVADGGGILLSAQAPVDACVQSVSRDVVRRFA